MRVVCCSGSFFFVMCLLSVVCYLLSVIFCMYVEKVYAIRKCFMNV